MSVRILVGDVRDRLRDLPDESVHCVVTSPPYFGLRDYGMPGQIGLEPTPAEFVRAMVEVFREVRRILRPDGTLWLNLGDSYASTTKGSGGTGKSGLMRDGRPDEGRQTADAANSRAKFSEPRKFSLDGLKPKDLLMIPARVAMALQDDGWYLRSDIIWHKPNPMPESVTDRPTSAHEHVFLLAKSERYFYDHEAVKEPVSVADWDNGTRVFGGKNKHGANIAHGSRTTGRVAGKGNAKTFRGGVYTGGKSFDNDGKMERDSHGNAPNESGLRNLRNVWTVATQPFSEAHFATFPPSLIEPCIKAGCPAAGTVLDPFGGAGTTGLVADRLGRNAILIELNPEYAAMAERRIRNEQPMFADVRLESIPQLQAAE